MKQPRLRGLAAACFSAALASPLLVGFPLVSDAHAASTGLVAAYTFDQGSGSILPDASGNGNNGAVSSGTWTTTGKHGGALRFNGSNSFVTVKDSPTLHLTTGMT